MRLARFVLPALIVLSSACASSQANDNELRVVEPKPKKNPLVITRDELQDPAITSRDALTAIRHLRPNFFVYRGPTTYNDPSAGATQFSQDYGPLRPLKELASMNTFTFVEVRYLDANAAQNRFGINANAGPVIVLVSNKDAQ
ncbi:MAG TPA: hypothetical protein VJT85_06690 [Gemmatimonadaceae bacterium]|nr:hypothetical protein [Gemmatimonadaceae bacterium]